MAKKPAPPMELTEKQKIFCREYIFDWNGTRAAKVAGYSENTAAVIASENLTKPYIQAYIEEIQKDLAKVAGLSRLKVLQEHQKLAFSSIAHLHNTWIERKEFEELTEDQKSCISEIQTQTKTVKDYSNDPENGEDVQVDFVKIKLYDKQNSLDSIAKMLGYNEPDKVDLTTKGQQITGMVVK
jgi:phage terminase small subunit